MATPALHRQKAPAGRESTVTARDSSSLLFVSWCAFHPPLWATLQRLVGEGRFDATVLAPPRVIVPRVVSPSGRLETPPDAEKVARLELVPLADERAPDGGFQPHALRAALHKMNPDAVWVHEEPTATTTRAVLERFYLRRRPRIICNLAENVWPRESLWSRIKSRLLTRRLDALAACGSESIAAVRRAGYVPISVPAHTLFYPVFPSEPRLTGGFALARKSGDFWIAFVGRVCPEKGWSVLTGAMRGLPPNVRAIFAGDGPDMAALRDQARGGELEGRIELAGALPPSDVRLVLRKVEVLVLPSLSTPRWREQFGRALAEAMAEGTPVIGSRSGAIPEVIGDAGLVFAEGDAAALRQALVALLEDPDLRQRLADRGRQRFATEFSIGVYARRLAALLRGQQPDTVRSFESS